MLDVWLGGGWQDLELSLPRMTDTFNEDLNVGGIHLWPLEFAFAPIREYLESLKKYPNPRLQTSRASRDEGDWT